MMRRLLPPHVPIVLWLATALGVASGLYSGKSFIAVGFPWLTVAQVLRSLQWALLIAVTFLVAFEVLRPLTDRMFQRLLGHRWRRPWTTAVPALLAATPWVAWGGLQWNLAHGIKPSIFFEAYALRLNALFLLACGVLWVVACWILVQRRPEHPQDTPPATPWRRSLASLIAIAALPLGLHLALSQVFEPGATPKSRPDVLILLVDALRADHLGVYGSDRPTPAIDALAADSLVFRHTISQSTFTKSSIASLFTGRHLYQHGVYWGSHKETPESITSDLLSLDETTLAETLVKQGYLTNAWVQNSHLRDFMGFGQGFVDYHDQQGSIQRIHRQAWPFFQGAAQHYNFFTYLHYIDLHDPYLPKAPYDTLFGVKDDVYAGIDLANWGTYLAAVRKGEEVPDATRIEHFRDYYDGLIRMVDDELAKLFAELKRTGLYDSTLIVLTSDHGDAFMEHGFISHSTTPYEELSRIPLIVKLPEQRFGGTMVEEQVRLIDVMPTILSLVGLDTPRPVAGCDLRPLWDAAAEPRAPNCLLAISEIAEDGAQPTVAVRSQRFKYLHFENRDDELYDLVADPLEQNPLRLEDLAVESSERREGELLRKQALEVQSLRQTPAQQIELDEQQIKELKALGYLD